MIDKEGHTVFLSYATPDRERVLPYYDWLKQSGLDVWIDCRSIRSGQNWDFEINRALDKSGVSHQTNGKSS
jgi:TIR domain